MFTLVMLNTYIQILQILIVDSVTAREHRGTDRALIRHYTLVDVVALVVVWELRRQPVLLELGGVFGSVGAGVAIPHVDATNELPRGGLVPGTSSPSDVFKFAVASRGAAEP